MPSDVSIPTITVGCDPELFVSDGQKIVSAHAFIPGSKASPFSVASGAVQPDGVAAEFNTVPAFNGGEMRTHCQTVLQQLKGYLPSGHKLVIEPVAFFDEEVWKTIPKEVQVLGCNPDFNAWTGEANPVPNDPDEFPKMRTASGHIHLGWTKDQDPKDAMHFEDCRVVAKQLDYWVGLWTLLFDPDDRRRKMYGRAGAFRPKPYGIEYRTPSNMWLKSSSLMEWIGDASIKALVRVFTGQLMEEKYGDLAQTIINENNFFWYEDKILPWVNTNTFRPSLTTEQFYPSAAGKTKPTKVKIPAPELNKPIKRKANYTYFNEVGNLVIENLT